MHPHAYAIDSQVFLGDTDLCVFSCLDKLVWGTGTFDDQAMFDMDQFIDCRWSLLNSLNR